MLLKEIPKPFDDKDFIYEIKFDGIRATIHVEPKKIKIFSRRGNDLTEIFPELKAICKLVKKKTIFDGEIVAFKDGLPSFSALQKRNLLKNKNHIQKMVDEIPVVFVTFDCLFEGSDLTNKPLLERKAILDKFEENDFFVKSTYISKNGKAFFQKAKARRLEGIVAKRKDSTYQPYTRSSDWLKIKNFQIETFYIGGYTDNKSKSSLLLGEYRNKEFCYVGKVALERRNELYDTIHKEKRCNSSPFIDFKEENCYYIRPKWTCQISYIERTESNHLRQPVLKK